MSRIFESLWGLVLDLGHLVVDLLAFAMHWSLLLAWIAWWLWGVDWKKLWPVLGRGAWTGLVLIMLVSALVWSRIAPSSCGCLGISVPNFWWQLGAVGLLAAVTLLCGWVQGLMGWEPAEISLEPPAEAHGEHGHGHHHHHH